MVKEAKGIYSMIPIVVQVSVSPTLLEETPKYVQSSSETAYYVNTSLLDILNVWCRSASLPLCSLTCTFIGTNNN